MCVVALGRKPRLGPGSRAERVQAWTLGMVLFLCWPVGCWFSHVTTGEITLPMHLCNWAAIAGGIALMTRRALAAEMVYFWGLAGTLNGLITPDLEFDAPDPRFFRFFALHSGVVIAALYVVIGLRLTPRPNAVWRMFGWTQVYVVAALIVNLIAERLETVAGNYAFLMHKPLHAESPLLDALGPHPWYILGLEAVCLTSFFILNLPFAIYRKMREA